MRAILIRPGLYQVGAYTVERIPPWHPYSWALYHGQSYLQTFRTLKAATDSVELRTVAAWTQTWRIAP